MVPLIAGKSFLLWSIPQKRLHPRKEVKHVTVVVSWTHDSEFESHPIHYAKSIQA